MLLSCLLTDSPVLSVRFNVVEALLVPVSVRFADSVWETDCVGVWSGVAEGVLTEEPVPTTEGEADTLDEADVAPDWVVTGELLGDAVFIVRETPQLSD